MSAYHFLEVREFGANIRATTRAERTLSVTEASARILGLDVGDRRIGVAVSDELGFSAQPVLTLTRRNKRRDLGSLARLIRKYKCSLVVVGNPLYMSGDISPQALKAQAFAHDLRLETGVVLTLWDERLSTTEAHRHLDAAGRGGNRRDVIDQVAAVLILQAFLDSRGGSRLAHEAERGG